MSASRILVVDDDHRAREAVAALLTRKQHEVVAVGSGEEALEEVRKNPYDLVITDLKMPGIDGIQVIKAIREIDPAIAAVVMTGYGTIENAVAAMKAGAFEYLTKPFKLDEVVLLAERALEYRRLQKENLSLRRQLRKRFRFENLIGDSEAMQQVFQLIEKVADSDSTILIQGESGTGKELVAQTLHYNSTRRDAPLIPVNCGAIPEDLLESELFGHEKGAFTGATAARLGRFELAHGGTIFLDEIGDMSPGLQVKVLRVLQERMFERVGGTRTIKVDVRVIAATNQDLEKAVAERRFREDLFYRLNVIPITLPALRQRREDIPLLVNHFLAHFSQKKKRAVEGISAGAMQALQAYDWPGNVRELENLMERVVILKGKGIVDPADLPEKVRGAGASPLPSTFVFPDEGIDFNRAVEEFENRLLLQAIAKSGGVKNRAAQLLRINRTTLIEKLKKKGLMSPREE